MTALEASATHPVVGILGAGQMGAAIGGVLRRHGGLEVVTALKGRSELTRKRAADAGLRDLDGVEEVIAICDIILSVLHTGAAEEVAEAAAEAMTQTGQRPLFVDCNAINPELAIAIDARSRQCVAGIRCKNQPSAVSGDLRSCWPGVRRWPSSAFAPACRAHGSRPGRG